MAPSRPNRPRAASPFRYVPHAHKRDQDVHIDMQYAKLSILNPLEFANEPWKYCADPTNCYLGLRFDRRDEFKEELRKMDNAFTRQLQALEDQEPDDHDVDEFQHILKEMRESNKGKKLEQVIHEEERIKQSRVNFAFYPNKQQMMEGLKAAKKAWKEEVKEKREEHVKRIMKQQEAGRQPKFPKRWSRDQTLDLELLERVKDWNVEDEPEDDTVRPMLEHEYGFEACVIYFKKSDYGWQPDTHNHPKFKDGKFPNQKISVHDLIQPSSGTYTNPLSEPCGEDRLRHFHFPSNNMRWIEEAIARYYDEDSGNHSDPEMSRKKLSNAERLLSREYWRGQLQGGLGSVHARHMRSRCSLIPMDSPSGVRRQQGRAAKVSMFPQDPIFHQRRPIAKNFAITLPYLHWETSSRRATTAGVIKEVTQELEANRRRFQWGSRMDTEDDEDDGFDVKKKGVFDMAQKWSHAKDGKFWTGKRRTKLGKYLLAVARVADAMDYEADERLLRENLHTNPPMHIRRTLDQSYFLTLENTSHRDRDQVVYRETRKDRSLYTRNTRVVMVDQLWLWILDSNTIITSFPRRSGRNLPDPSDVHHSLRQRLESMHEEGIQSIYDLALIIIDECSRVFFDRTKLLDERPEVMEFFGATVGRVIEHTTIASERFWRNNDIRALKFAPSGTIEAVNKMYLDINPEGTLLRESQDVVEELQIMSRIYDQQIHVVRDFRKFLGHMNGESKNKTDEVRTLIKFLQQSQNVAGDRGRGPVWVPDELPVPESTIQEANDLLELIRNRNAEIKDLEAAILGTNHQLQNLLSLKQHQASIIEGRAALEKEKESVRQGRAIMAFTLVTILFLPLGFLAAFFGMNNEQINQAAWMTLHEQIKYMFGVSTAIIAVSVSIAFSPWTSATLDFLVKTPVLFFLEYTGVKAVWRKYIGGHGHVEEKNEETIKWIHGHGERARRKKVAKRLKAEKEAELKKARDVFKQKQGKNQGAVFTLVARTLYGDTSEMENKSRRWPRMRPGINGENVGGFMASGALPFLGRTGSDIEKGQKSGVLVDEI